MYTDGMYSNHTHTNKGNIHMHRGRERGKAEGVPPPDITLLTPSRVKMMVRRRTTNENSICARRLSIFIWVIRRPIMFVAHKDNTQLNIGVLNHQFWRKQRVGENVWYAMKPCRVGSVWRTVISGVYLGEISATNRFSTQGPTESWLKFQRR